MTTSRPRRRAPALAALLVVSALLPALAAVPAAAAGKAIAIAAGANHACAILADRTVVCWGQNRNAQLGNGSTTSRTRPVAVEGLSGVRVVAAGRHHTCAIVGEAGDVWCWGQNSYGQLGTETASSRSLVPIRVPGVTAATALAAGDRHTCAIVGEGSVLCWGANEDGQLGVSGVGTRSQEPVEVRGIVRASSIGAGDAHTCIRIRDGTARCWGANAYGQLGRGNVQPSVTPTIVAREQTLTAVTAGRFHTCALTAERTVRCWGWNAFGALGTGEPGGRNAAPVAVPRLTKVKTIDAGEGLTCVVMETGRVRCWGPNDFGGLGNRTNEDSASPVGVNGVPNATSIAVGHAFACAVLQDGRVRCWGQNSQGQLGDGTTLDRSSSADVLL